MAAKTGTAFFGVCFDFTLNICDFSVFYIRTRYLDKSRVTLELIQLALLAHVTRYIRQKKVKRENAWVYIKKIHQHSKS